MQLPSSGRRSGGTSPRASEPRPRGHYWLPRGRRTFSTRSLVFSKSSVCCSGSARLAQSAAARKEAADSVELAEAWREPRPESRLIAGALPIAYNRVLVHVVQG